MNQEQWMLINGFSTKGDIYIVGGGNTYIIKDFLKENGYQYNKFFGWYTSSIRELPAPYTLVHFTFDELMSWEEKYHQARPYSDIKDRIKKKASNSHSILNHKFLNEVGDRFNYLPVNVKKIQTKINNGKNYYIYHFIYNNDYYLTWTTNKKLNLEIGQLIFLTGTIISHYLYYGHKINKINRCIIKNEI